MAEPKLSQIRDSIERASAAARVPRAAVLVPLLPREDGGHDVLFELRSEEIDIQPGEVCFPGGHLEPGEDGLQAAVRETCEELLVEPGQIEVLGKLAGPAGIGGSPIEAYVGVLRGYEGTFSADEVARTFRIPLAWLLENDPTCCAATRGPSPQTRWPARSAFRWRGCSKTTPRCGRFPWRCTSPRASPGTRCRAAGTTPGAPAATRCRVCMALASVLRG